MEILEDAVETAIIVVTQLGIPVAILFVIGYRMNRSTGRNLSPARHGNDPKITAARGVFGERSGWACWEIKQCSLQARDACSARRHNGLSCWQACRASIGRLKAECPHCELFLGPPARD